MAKKKKDEPKLDLTHADVVALKGMGMTDKDIKSLVANAPRAISHPAISTTPTTPQPSPLTDLPEAFVASDPAKAMNTLNAGAEQAFTLSPQAQADIPQPTVSPSTIAQEEASGMTPAQFATAVLQGIGAPTTAQNIQTVTDWASAEGGAGPEWGIPTNTDAYNPLNTDLPEPGSVSTNSATVQSYPNWAEGVQGTEQTLENTPAYANILNALKGNDPESVVAADVGSTGTWTPDWEGSSAPSGYGTTGNLNAPGPTTGSTSAPSSTSSSALASLLAQLETPISSSSSIVGGALTPQTLQQMVNANQAITPNADQSSSYDNTQSSYNQMIASLIPGVVARQ